ncbi:MAG: DUF1015 domain-containing protein [Candidatus Omnitrophica bacterium]|nr:DUF1015 domain-containing protein [Candidatus Omnitrophota bacterium]
MTKVQDQPDFRPFREWRYEPRREELSRLIAPPYDIISSPEQNALYQRSPYNVVRLTLGREANFYDEAARRWKEWREQGILVQAKRPAFYLYEQTFKRPADGRLLRRTAVVGILKLENSSAVLRHEATFRGPKQDRTLLLEKTRANLSPIFGLFPDSQKALASVAGALKGKPPLFEASEEDGTLHRGWAIEGESDQKKIQALIAQNRILIADGHHRYETSLEYRNALRKKFPKTPQDAPFDFVLTALVAFEDPGLVMLPTHRVLSSLGPSSKEEFLERLRKHFDCIPCAPEKLAAEVERRPKSEKVFGAAFAGKENFLLRLKSLDSIRKFLPGGKPSLWYEVEANLLNYFIFDVLWGLPESERQSLIEYTHASGEALERVQREAAEAAFLLRPPEVREVHQLAEAGEKMPQKTTYFYPKLADGLFFYAQE